MVSHIHTQGEAETGGANLKATLVSPQDFPFIPCDHSISISRKRYAHFHLSNLVFFGTFLPSDFFLLPSS